MELIGNIIATIFFTGVIIIGTIYFRKGIAVPTIVLSILIGGIIVKFCPLRVLENLDTMRGIFNVTSVLVVIVYSTLFILKGVEPVIDITRKDVLPKLLEKKLFRIERKRTKLSKRISEIND